MNRSLVDRLLRRWPRPQHPPPLDDGSTLDVRCPRCAARLRARCGRTNSCPRCRERVAVPGADVARAAMPHAGTDLTVRLSLTKDETRTVPAPVLVLGYERPWYLLRLRGEETAWIREEDIRLITPNRPPVR